MQHLPLHPSHHFFVALAVVDSSRLVVVDNLEVDIAAAEDSLRIAAAAGIHHRIVVVAGDIHHIAAEAGNYYSIHRLLYP